MNGTTHKFEPTADHRAALRRAFGCFGTGVTIVTMATKDGPLGLTANSFSSVSLEPPMVLWSPARDSRRHDAFAEATHFCIHVLGADQLDLALHFATQGSGFDQFDWAPGPMDVPTLGGCLATFHCATHRVHPAGDHSVILGEVIEVSQDQDARAGLLFDQGRFGRFTPNKN